MFRLPLPLFIFSSMLSLAQTPATVPISNTGCTMQVYCFPGRFDTYDLADGSTAYADDCEIEEVTYGIYCVKLKNPIPDLDAAEDTVVTYLDFLKLDYGIVKSKEYDKGDRLNKNNKTRGIHDTWEDGEKNRWKIKGWTDGNFIVVLYMYSSKELPEKKQDIYLDGLRFPGMK